MGRYTGKKCRLVSMFGLTGSFFLVEIVVGYVTNSMALVADSFHMLSDIAALVIAFLSVRMAPKSWDKNTYGWARAEVLGALVNAVFLVALCFSITVESLKRFYEPEEIHNPKMILLVGVLGLIVNLMGLCLFHEHGHSHGGGGGHGHSHGHGHGHSGHGAHSHLADMADAIDGESSSSEDIEEGRPAAALTKFPTLDTNSNGSAGNDAVDSKKKSGSHGHSHSASQMNMRGVFLHVLADALGSVVVIVSALIMWLSEWEYKKYVDPALSLCLVLLMLRSVWPLLMESALILLQTVPTHIQVDALKRKLLEQVDGVLAVHEFHVWQLTGDRIIASAHIRCYNLDEYMKVAENIKEFFHNEGIHSTTIQPEFLEYHPGREYIRGEDCILRCPADPSHPRLEPNCQSSKCCPPPPDYDKATAAATTTSASAQNTPTAGRRRRSSSAGHGEMGRSRSQSRQRQQQQQQQQPQKSQQQSAIRTRHKAASRATPNATSTPNKRRSAPNLFADNNSNNNNNLTAELDLSANGGSGSTTPSNRTSSNSSNAGNNVRPPLNRTSSDQNNGTARVLLFGSPSKLPNSSSFSSSPIRRSGDDAVYIVNGASPARSQSHNFNGSSNHNFTDDFVLDRGEEENSRETTPMFCSPRSSSRVVRIISKQSNV